MAGWVLLGKASDPVIAAGDEKRELAIAGGETKIVNADLFQTGNVLF